MDVKPPHHRPVHTVKSESSSQPAPAPTHTTEHHKGTSHSSKKWYQRTLWIVLLLIFFFPVGLFLMWKYAKWAKPVKIVVSALLAVSIVGTMVAAANSPPSITVNALSDGRIATDGKTYTVTGTDTLADTVTVNNQHASLNSDGTYSATINLQQGDNKVTVSASRGSKHTEEQFVIHRSTDAELKAKKDAEAAAAAKKAQDEATAKVQAAAAAKAAQDAAAAKAQADAAAKAQADAAAAAQAAIDNAPADYKSALNQANSYANTQYMSKQGVYDQLVSPYGGQFSAAAAQFAIDHVTADWNANALEKAKEYQSQQSMSPAAIHDQLTSPDGEQFTEAQADYAIQNLNN